MKFFLSFTHDEQVIFIASCIIKLLFILVVLWQFGFFQDFSKLQSDGYLPLAVNLFEHQAFSYSTTTPLVPEALQVPGYPLFLAVFAAPFMSITLALVVQMLLMSFSAIILYRLTEGFFSQRVRFFAALLYAIEPFASFTSSSPLSESLFMFLFLLSLYLLRRAYENNQMRDWILSGFLVGASILVRPIGTYLFPILLVILAVILWRYKKILPLWGIVASLVAFAILPVAWAARNHADFGVWTIATKGPYTLYFYDVEQLLEYKEHINATQADAELLAHAQADNPAVKTADDLRSPVYASYLNHASLQYIKANLPLFIKLQTFSLGTFFFSDGYRLLLEEMGAPIAPLPNITKALATGQVRTIVSYFAHNPFSALVFIVGTVLWAGMTLLAIAALFVAWGKKEWRTLVFILLLDFLVAYFAILTGPVAQARYRVAITPFLFLLGIYTFAQIHARYKRKI